ncbi:hypothetical protein ACFPVT_07985 [Corynebacterium choanae]|uniref:Uncharacterized protein n=1 Tax=Corynebacterium choanae TaxID=1862358 RepID=A0A3G6J8B5_9CORY|nr:hypothetical protein [Corynebacterium choanae]AZA14052.1 hypothetical protein CCHOA_08315 [Corynebacterium choanae]
MQLEREALHTLSWSKLENTNAGHIQTLKDATGSTVAQVTTDGAEQLLTVQGQAAPWKLTGSKDAGLTALLPGGQVFTATGRDRQIGRATVIDVDCTRNTYVLLNETKQDWVIDDAQGNTIAQFTGAGHGVRAPSIEFREGVVLPDDEAVFLSWIAREALASKLLSSTASLTISLVFVTIFVLLVFFL